MADQTALEVLNDVIDSLAGKHVEIPETLVPALLVLAGYVEDLSGNITEAVAEWLEAHPEVTTTVEDDSITTRKLVDGAVERDKLGADVIGELEHKADVDGYYEQLTAGAADNLTGRGDGVAASYLYRTTGGDADVADGTATIKSIKGNTLRWHQMIPSTHTAHSGNVSCVTSNGVVTITGSKDSDAFLPLTEKFAITSGHKYLGIGGYDDTTTSNPKLYLDAAGYLSGANNAITKSGVVFTCSADKSDAKVNVKLAANTTSDATIRPMFFDLTQMFGAGSEPSTVAEFEALYPLPYYPYDAGSLLPVQMEGIETVGFNQWDEEWELGLINGDGTNAHGNTTIRSKNHIRVFSGAYYYFKSPNDAYFYYYDASGVCIGSAQVSGNSIFQTLPNTKSMRFRMFTAYGTTYNNDVCINLHWSGYRDGEYEPYWSAQRVIAAIAENFPTGMKRVGDKYDALYSDHADVVIGEVTLTGDNITIQTAELNADETCMRVSVNVTGWDGVPSTEFESDQFEDGAADWARVTLGHGKTTTIGFFLGLPTTVTSAAEAKTWIANHTPTFYYALATPTVTPIDPPLNLGYKVSDFGTERVMVPTGEMSAPPTMQVVYGLNAVDTIRRLPEEYISNDSDDQLIAALGTFLNATITKTWDATDGRYEYSITAN